MSEILFHEAANLNETTLGSLRRMLDEFRIPFKPGDRIGIKLHWGERGNRSFLPPAYAKVIVQWLLERNLKPYVFDTTVLYSGGRRNGEDALETAKEHGYHETYLGCPVVIADGMDGRNVTNIPSQMKHFEDVQVASVFDTDGFVIFSHFKGHLASGFGGAIKNLSMGFASRAQKQRMHADVQPVLKKEHCSRCGLCIEICPSEAAQMHEDEYPFYDLELCIGCAQCIGLCPEVALEILWNSDNLVFQEKLVETAAAIWEKIKGRTVLLNALLNITVDCDCLPGKNPSIAPDAGFIGGYDPVTVDAESVRQVGADVFDKTHPHVPWRRQFTFAKEVGFSTGAFEFP